MYIMSCKLNVNDYYVFIFVDSYIKEINNC